MCNGAGLLVVVLEESPTSLSVQPLFIYLYIYVYIYTPRVCCSCNCWPISYAKPIQVVLLFSTRTTMAAQGSCMAEACPASAPHMHVIG